MKKEKYIGIDIGGSKCSVVSGDLSANILKKVKINTTTFEDTIYNLMHILEKMMTPEVRSIGISCGGPLDSEKGLILSPPNLPGWDSIPIVDMLQQKFGIPAYLQNDANACAIAEWKFGAGQGYKNVIFLTFGTGMGAGLILNGRLYSGICDMAGEIGHVRIYENGHTGYGKNGAFEGYCSGSGIAQYGLGSAKEVAEKALAGDREAINVFCKVGEDLGKGLSILIDLLNPEIIIIGSIYARATRLIEPSMRRMMAREALSRNLDAVQIVPAQLGEAIGDIAALCVAYQEYQ